MNPARSYRFGPFHLDVRERRLSRGGTVIPLRIKVFELLRLLVENAGRLVTKEELLDAVWPGTAVEENNLTHTISVLRKALGENATGQHYVETVPRVGYRFVAPIEPDIDAVTVRPPYSRCAPGRKSGTAPPPTASGSLTPARVADRRW